MKLLIVDDSKVNLKIAKHLINENKVCRKVTTADTGEESLDMMSKERFDVIILDIIMPGLSGLDVLKLMKERGYLGFAKVVMFTSLSDRSALKESFELGASDYINKPIEPVEFLARLKSVLNQKKLENELVLQVDETRKKNIELKKLYDELRRTQSQVIQREQLAGIGQLAAGIAHEINNPLGYISSNLETLIDYYNAYKGAIDRYIAGLPMSDDIDIDTLIFMKEDLPVLYEDMQEGLNRVKEIVNGIRFFSRVDSMSQFESFDINQGLKSALLLTQTERNGIGCKKELGEVPEIEAYAREVNQALLNVLMNSIQAIHEKYSEDNLGEGLIQIKSYSEGQDVYCVIEDNGCGISSEYIDEVFNPFFTTKPVGSGAGLGLSVVYEAIVNKHGGTVDITSQFGEGTKVSIRLPIVYKAGLQA